MFDEEVTPRFITSDFSIKKLETSNLPFVFRYNCRRVYSEKNKLTKQQILERKNNIDKYEKIIHSGGRLFED